MKRAAFYVRVSTVDQHPETSGASGRAFLVVVAVPGEMETALLIERARSGMARARAAGRQIGRGGWMSTASK